MSSKAEVLFEDIDSAPPPQVLAEIEYVQPEPTKPPVSGYVVAPQEHLFNLPKPVKPIYCVSDLHLGDCGRRDNFSCMSGGQRLTEFGHFLEFVEKNNGQLLILGDFFELWQSNMSAVLTAREQLLDRLARMKAIYVLGNHDIDLVHFIHHNWLGHSFFQRMCLSHTAEVAGRKFHFIHGHQTDDFCSGDTPGLGRITAIYTGLKEDRNGSPLYKGKYPTVEARSIGFLEGWVDFIGRLRGKPGRIQQMNRGLCHLLDRDRSKYDVLVSGHTHRAGKIAGWSIYNTGTWAEQTNSFVVISRYGGVGVFDWVDDKAVPNQRKLFV